MKLVFATHNNHKLQEILELLNNSTELLSLNDIGYHHDIEETGSNLTENALIKARTIYNHFNYNVFADDTGLEIDALGGAPGVLSARFAGEEKDAQKNMAKVLMLMKDQRNRTARFKSVIALILEGQEYLFEGVVEGKILHTPSGKMGIGYDPIFQPEGFSCSFAEMDATQKNKISHRGRAVEKLIAHLISIQ